MLWSAFICFILSIYLIIPLVGAAKRSLVDVFRGGSRNPNDRNDETGFEDDNFSDLKNLFRQSRDNEESSSSDDGVKKGNDPTSAVTNLHEFDRNPTLSLIPAVSLLWRGMPSVVRFAGWYLMMESVRFVWSSAQSFLSDRKRMNVRGRSAFSSAVSKSSSTGSARNMLDADDYLSSLGAEVSSISSGDSQSRQRGGSSKAAATPEASVAPSSLSSSALGLEQLQTDQAELWSAVAKLHGLQTEAAAAQKNNELAAEQKWSTTLRDIEAMVLGMRDRSARMEQQVVDAVQQVEALAQDLEELHSEV